jgi:hypothetical protein
VSAAHALSTAAAAAARSDAAKSTETCRAAVEENKALKLQVVEGQDAKRRVVSLEYQVEELRRQLEVQRKMIALADEGDRGGEALLMNLKHQCKNLRVHIDGLQLQLDSKDSELLSLYTNRAQQLQAADAAAERELVKDAMVGSIFKRADVFRHLFEQEAAAAAAAPPPPLESTASSDARPLSLGEGGDALEIAISFEGGAGAGGEWILDDDAVSCISQYICAAPPRGVHCTSLALSSASTSTISLTSLSICAHNNSWLVCIALSQMPLGDDGVSFLAPAVSSCSNLTSLLLSACGVSDGGISTLAGCLHGHSKLQQLGLRSNSISDTGAENLAQLLRSCPSLADLSLHQNAVGDEGACALVSVIDDHKLHRVKLLRLTRNPLTTRAIRVILGRDRQAKIYWDSV